VKDDLRAFLPDTTLRQKQWTIHIPLIYHPGSKENIRPLTQWFLSSVKVITNFRISVMTAGNYGTMPWRDWRNAPSVRINRPAQNAPFTVINLLCVRKYARWWDMPDHEWYTNIRSWQYDTSLTGKGRFEIYHDSGQVDNTLKLSFQTSHIPQKNFSRNSICYSTLLSLFHVYEYYLCI